MTVAVRNLIDSFHALSDAEKQEAAVEILKYSSSGVLSDDALCEIAGELFTALDNEESKNAQP